MPADACVVGTTRAEGTRAAWSSASRYVSPFMTYWSLMFAIADANCLGGDAKGATSSTGACCRACRARDAT